MFCDDPEDSPWQSAKVAPAFDAAFYANIASRFQYESWGCKLHSWHPIFTSPDDVPPKVDGDKILGTPRPEQIVFGGGLDDYSSYRGRRLRKLSEAFPAAQCYGRGWPKGEKNYSELAQLYLKTQIGWNIHRTTGPINRRMFQLPAHGVMQICDNKTGLGQIFELGKEVVGFDTIDEAIELTKYYLEHEAERESIARAGYERFWKDYHAEANWARLRDQLLEWGVKPGERKSGVKQKLPSRNVAYFFGVARKSIQDEAQRLVRSAKAAKREFLRKDPWWKIYERIFTSEAVYLPEYSESGTGGSLAKSAQRMAAETPALHKPENSVSITPQEGALRWAMTQLIGSAKNIGIFDPCWEDLERYASVDAKRRIMRIDNPLNFSDQGLDLLLCVPDATDSNTMASNLRSVMKMAPVAVFGFPIKTMETEGQNLKSPNLNKRAVFWMLKALYEEVIVFEMPDPVVPWLEPINFGGDRKSLVAKVKIREFPDRYVSTR